MLIGLSGLVAFGEPVKVEYCDNVIDKESSTSKLDKLRFPYFTDSTTVETIEVNSQKEKDRWTLKNLK